MKIVYNSDEKLFVPLFKICVFILLSMQGFGIFAGILQAGGDRMMLEGAGR